MDALTNPIKAIIYKKILDNGQVAYVPYLPRTDADWVSLNESITIHGTAKAANTDLDTIIRTLNSSIGAPGDTKSSATSASLQAQINYISEELISKSGAFVYKGSSAAQSTAETPLAFCVRVLGHGTVPAAGWVFNISNNFKIDSSGRLIASTDGDAYKGGTNIVIIGDGTSGDPFRFDALGGDMGNHALTSEAIGLASLNGSTITFTHVDGSTAGTITFSTIGTTSVGTVGIAATSADIVSGSSQLVTAGAVYDFAADAGKIRVTETASDSSYYITFVSSNDTSGQPVYIDAGIRYNPSTNILNTTVTTANYASTANFASTANIATLAESVRSSLSVFGQSYNGSTSKTITKGNGLTLTTAAGSDTTTISVGAGDGIVVNTNDVAINKGNGLNFDSNHKLVVKANGSATIKVNGDGVGLETSGVAAGTYSAVQVDTYGRATAGGQSVVFANSTSDPDLNQLVVGGLAFVSTSETAKDPDTVPTNSINLNN